MSKGELLGERRRALEECFFQRHNEKLLNEFRQHLASMERREQLADASGVHDDAVLDRLLALDIGPETLAALTLIPLVEVAWADGKVPEAQKAAVLKASEQAGVSRDDDAYPLLDGWLTQRPEPQMLTAWKEYTAALRRNLDDQAVDQLKHDLLDRAETIARVAGRFLGFGERIGKAERRMLDELASVFD